ncbi:MAG: hypothetical protein KDA25_04705, partial [Phycisphaerales bacterium]|nr:hypothetical protein [Phycisphaerales bacterium]
VYWERDDQRALMTLGALPPPAGALVVRSDDGARAIAAYSDADRRPHDLHLVRVGDRWWISGYTFEYDPDVVERRDECAAGAVLARLDFEWGLPDNRSRGVRPGFVKSISDLDPYRGLRSAVIRGEDPSATLDVFDGFNSGLSAHPYRGKRIRLTAVVRSERARRAAIWMRIDGADHPIAFDNMDPRPIVGTTGWRTYSVVLDVAPNAEQIVFGALLSGSGTVWVDDMVVEVVGLDVPSTALVVQP